MATNYDNTNSGAVFKAKEKRHEKSPDRTGECEIKCPNCGNSSKFWISGWLKSARASGQQFLSLAFTAKDADSGKASPDRNNTASDFDDGDIPF